LGIGECLYGYIDVETRECLGIWVSMARHQFVASKFIRMVLYCKNKQFIVDKGVWYKNFKEWDSITKMRNLVKEIA